MGGVANMTAQGLRTFYGAIADGSIGRVDPESVYGLVNEVASDPAGAADVMRLSAADPEGILEGLLETYHDVAVMDDNGLVDSLESRRDAAFDRLVSSVSRKQGVAEDDFVEACASLRDGFGSAFDRMMAAYYDG